VIATTIAAYRHSHPVQTFGSEGEEIIVHQVDQDAP